MNPNSNFRQIRLSTFSCLGHCCTKETATVQEILLLNREEEYKKITKASLPSLSLADLTLAEMFVRVTVWSLRSSYVHPHHSVGDLYTQLPALLGHTTSFRRTQIKAEYSTTSIPRAEDHICLCAQGNICSRLLRYFSAFQDTKLELMEYSVLQAFYFFFSPFFLSVHSCLKLTKQKIIIPGECYVCVIFSTVLIITVFHMPLLIT